MISVGLNGFGRIGKCIFLQLIHNKSIEIKVINAPDFDINKLESYLKFDSVHKYSNDFIIEIIDNNSFKINNKLVYILRNRDAKQLNWRNYKINHIIDATGVYLTQEKAKQHNVDYVIMSAPAKDNTPMFVYGANHNEYNNEKIISNASCTTNSIVPVLRDLINNFGIKSSNFTTIHASTSSQKVVDTANSKSRTNRSIFNNIIPHTTGASSSIYKIIPELEGKITGTSVRVPVNNVSLIDLNVELERSTTLNEIFESFSENKFIKVNSDNLVSSDFISTTCPSIIDKNACLDLNNNQFKIMIWYDNEWSYASQLIKLLETISNFNTNSYFIENKSYKNKKVIVRLDLNVPRINNKITDDYRIKSTIPTLKRILNDSPKKLIIMSHLGRPAKHSQEDSLIIVKSKLENYLNEYIEFLPEGLSESTIKTLNNSKCRIFLLENLRFHSCETKYKNIINSNSREILNNLGDCYVNDAFGCMHRDHLSITGILLTDKSYGYLVDNEIKALKMITGNITNSKVLAIIGGGKMDDKISLLLNLSKKVDNIYIAGGNINSIIKNNMNDYLQEISNNKAKITLMEDGLASESLNIIPSHISTFDLRENKNFFDIGLRSLITLSDLIDKNDIIFWNGTLGVVEDSKYKYGSEMLIRILINAINKNKNKKVIIGGGDTGGFVNKYKHNFTHISTGGGASIEYINNDDLIGLKLFKH